MLEFWVIFPSGGRSSAEALFVSLPMASFTALLNRPFLGLALGAALIGLLALNSLTQTGPYPGAFLLMGLVPLLLLLHLEQQEAPHRRLVQAALGLFLAAFLGPEISGLLTHKFSGSGPPKVLLMLLVFPGGLYFFMAAHLMAFVLLVARLGQGWRWPEFLQRVQSPKAFWPLVLMIAAQGLLIWLDGGSVRWMAGFHLLLVASVAVLAAASSSPRKALYFSGGLLLVAELLLYVQFYGRSHPLASHAALPYAWLIFFQAGLLSLAHGFSRRD